LFFAEMWERFSYYGMCTLLKPVVTTATVDANPRLGFDVATAGVIWFVGRALGNLFAGLVEALGPSVDRVPLTLTTSATLVWVGGRHSRFVPLRSGRGPEAHMPLRSSRVITGTSARVSSLARSDGRDAPRLPTLSP